jgi:hypothetical protein
VKSGKAQTTLRYVKVQSSRVAKCILKNGWLTDCCHLGGGFLLRGLGTWATPMAICLTTALGKDHVAPDFSGFISDLRGPR